MEQQLGLPEPPPDAAAQAFNELRQEVAFMRRAMEKFTDEHPKLEIPDYTDTLNDIGKFTKSLAMSFREMKATPALQTTPEQIGKQIANVGAEARKAEQATLNNASANLRSMHGEVTERLKSARTADAQYRWLIKAGWIGAIGGIFIGWIGPHALASLAPKSWHWPERVATVFLAHDLSTSGQRILLATDEQRWKWHVALDDRTAAGKKAMEGCFRQALESTKPTKCEVTLHPLK